ncbi:protein kinase [Mucilaginibacter sp. AK015]|uniref:serine/threonine protein kinase n=1 Tax=Mucilaginibacter sp. AK015 TaxID=2723072 RepID=UPI00161B75CA|nr:protein kinase [Mucilaginibacter sp. AK015]MBB5397946.1 serine/threonine-protein kinase [Mucilaginibacter sp. AK015]
MSIHSLNQAFLDQFNISGFFQSEKRGGQKVVYFPTINGESCVLKHFPGGKDERFERELEIYEKFKHISGITKVLKVEIYGKDILVFEEFIPGDTLSDILLTYKGDAAKITALIKNIIGILEPIWKERFVHRDLKPENIILKSDGTPIIIDFGIARDLDAVSITGTGWQPKSWRYAAPEQFAGDKDQISYRTDFFSIGILAYALYFQQLPFGNTEAEVATRYKGLDQSFYSDSGFTLNGFCEAVMKFSPAERPRLIEDLYNLL